ncbi:hypothetical protein LLEC1_00517 [Akanthomyces lecanii]|uniref:MOSC domain-containing protein n=1 Tax=Cordyceps confragosa TaxID=2714763 RepID=A0A179I920_CORDF|nr:hypothetical protein LLEC1_00517 [Akanthomyces lecanii]
MTSWLAEVASLLDVSSVFLFLITLVVFSIPVFIIFPPIPVERSDALGQTHSKIGVPPLQSNLRDQWTAAEANTTTTTTTNGHANGRAGSSDRPLPPRIHSLHIYPLKSCRGIELAEATAASMANIRVDLWVPDASKHSRQLGPMTGEDGSGACETFAVVRFPWRSPGVRGLVETMAAKLSRGLSAAPEREFMLPMSFPSAQEAKARGYSHAEVTHFRSVISSLNMSPELPKELAHYLGLEPAKLGLFRLDPARRRQVLGCAPTRDVAGYQPEIDFQDAYPLHLLNLSSVRALESRIRRDADIDRLDARRFRPNIIVSGLPEYDEDDWRSVQFKAVSRKDADSLFDVSCRTVRCKLPNVDPATGIRHKVEPDYALRHYREIDTGAPKKGCMGMQMCPLFSPDGAPPDLQSTIRVGMEIAVLKRGAHHAL